MRISDDQQRHLVSCFSKSLKSWTVIFDGDEETKVWWSNVQKGCLVPPPPPLRETSPILTSVAFFSASSSFSWASLRASENLSNSSSVPFNFFCRATKSSSSWGAFQFERWSAWARTGATEEGRKRGRDREKERAATGECAGKKGRERRGS